MRQILGVLFLTFTVTGHADFEVDQNLLDQITKRSLNETFTTLAPPKARTLTVEFVGLFPEVQATNRYFSNQYQDLFLPGLAFGLENEIPATWATWVWGPKVGYAYSRRLTSVSSLAGEQRSDVVTLHWLPLQLQGGLVKALTNTVKLSASLGAGAGYLYQAGKLDGLSQGFWIPTLAPGLGLSFHRLPWIDSLDFKVNYLFTFASSNRIEGLSASMGLSVGI